MKGTDAGRENDPADVTGNVSGNSAPMNGSGLPLADGSSYAMAGAGAEMEIPSMNGHFSQGAQGYCFVPPQKQKPASAPSSPVAPQMQQPLMAQQPSIAPQIPKARQRSSSVLAPNTRGAKASKGTVKKKSTTPSHDKASPRNNKSLSCDDCHRQRIKCMPPGGTGSCDACKKKRRECVRSMVDMRTNSSNNNKHREAVSSCERLLAQILCLTGEVEEHGYRVDLLRAIENTTVSLEGILPKYFPGADDRWPVYIQLVREKYPLPPADGTQKLAEARATFSKLKEIFMGHIQRLEDDLVGSLAMKAHMDPSFLEGLNGDDLSLAYQVQDYGIEGCGDVFQRLVCSPLEERASKIFRPL